MDPIKGIYFKAGTSGKNLVLRLIEIIEPGTRDKVSNEFRFRPVLCWHSDNWGFYNKDLQNPNQDNENNTNHLKQYNIYEINLNFVKNMIVLSIFTEIFLANHGIILVRTKPKVRNFIRMRSETTKNKRYFENRYSVGNTN